MGFLERLRQEQEKREEARGRDILSSIETQKDYKQQEGKKRQREQEEIRLAKVFLQKSRVLNLLVAAKPYLQQHFNHVVLTVSDKSMPIAISLRWGKKNNYGSMVDYWGIGVTVYSNGDIAIPKFIGKDWKSTSRLSLAEWSTNKEVLEEKLWEAYKNPQLLDYVREQNEKRARKEPPSPPYYDIGGRGPCLPGDVLISSVPNGLCLLRDLQVGDYVWTVDGFGQRVQTIIVKKTKRPAVKNHKMVYVVLKDGRELVVSPGHPTIDYKEIGSLVKGDDLDMSTVASIKVIPYKGKYTYDILPYGETGGYWANGILIGSTLSSNFEKTILDDLYKSLHLHLLESF